ncbi:MAG: ATP-binding protein, partial [Mycoplasmataceae bacterium]|nr:ATP-binding protein [Mycoplasmataceae bacterium]
ILYRTNIKIVAGDDKQLKPSSFFNTRYVEDEEDETDNQDEKDEDGNYKIKYSDLDSLLLRAIVSNWNEILLNNHYRSVSQDLIDFSNKHIYDNKLNIATFNKSFDSKALQVVNVNGYFVNRINKEEAIQIIEIITENLLKYKKILIITFNEAQSEHITSKILSSKNKEMILKMRESNIIITNLENVQGNEGDLVILSIAYARPSNDKKMRNSFGPLNMDGGKNRLNVAVTRAKKKMIIVKSFKADDMSVSPTNLNAQFFKEFIKHCDDVYRNVESEKKWLSFDTKFENDVHTTLENYILSNTNLSLMTRYKIGTKRIDIAIFDKKLDKVILGIELHKWDDNNPEILEEFDKQTFIEKRGYPIYNIFEITWRVNKESIILEILDLL